MLTKEKITRIQDKMEERDYMLYCTCNSSEGVTESLTFTTPQIKLNHFKGKALPILTAEIFANGKGEIEFQLSFIVSKSINVLSTPKCGSFFNDEYFYKIENKIFLQAKVLTYYDYLY